MEILIKLIATGSILGILDFLWLTFGARKLYESEMPSLLLDKPNIVPAATFYLLYIIGVVWFVLAPALEKNSVLYAVFSGGLFGLVAYATYGMTNLAVFKGFTAKAMVIDMVWGMCLTAITAVGAYYIVKWLV